MRRVVRYAAVLCAGIVVGMFAGWGLTDAHLDADRALIDACDGMAAEMDRHLGAVRLMWEHAERVDEPGPGVSTVATERRDARTRTERDAER